MASSAAALSANSCIRFLNNGFYRKQQTQNLSFFKIRASSTEQGDDCNVEECAPDKEVGKVSMEWLAGEKTKVAGTFPPRKRDWSGYVEKDTAGQTNIYSVEPAVYVAESAISSGSSGTSADGAENTAAVVGFGGLIAVAAASVILLQVGKNQPPQINKPFDYAGPSLSYYITKFKPSEIIVQTQVDSAQVSDTVMSSTSAENAETVVIPETVMSSTSAETQETVAAPQIDSEPPSETVTSTENSESGVATPEALQVEVGSG